MEQRVQHEVQVLVVSSCLTEHRMRLDSSNWAVVDTPQTKPGGPQCSWEFPKNQGPQNVDQIIGLLSSGQPGEGPPPVYRNGQM